MFWKIGMREDRRPAAGVPRARRRCRRRPRRPAVRIASGLPSSVIVPARGSRDAEQRLHHLAAAGADQAVEAEDLALAQVEGDVGEFGRVRQARRPSSTGSPSGDVDLREDLVDGAADHQRDRAAPGVASATSPAPTELAVAEHRVAVGDAEDLLELVADEEDRLALALQLARRWRKAPRPPCATARRSARP